MQTIIVVEMKGHAPLELKNNFRKQIMKELEEGLIVTDETFSVSTYNIQGEIGLEFNKE